MAKEELLKNYLHCSSRKNGNMREKGEVVWE